MCNRFSETDFRLCDLKWTLLHYKLPYFSEYMNFMMGNHKKSETLINFYIKSNTKIEPMVGDSRPKSVLAHESSSSSVSSNDDFNERRVI